MFTERKGGTIAERRTAPCWFDGENEMAVTPVDAATVVLLRHVKGSDRGFEVLMVLRSSKSSFVPSSYVFPGGRVEEEDILPEIKHFSPMPLPVVNRRRPDKSVIPEGAVAFRVAAIRETFEEVGLLFACRSDGPLLSLNRHDTEEQFVTYRRLVHSGEISFTEMLKREDLMMALNRLHYFSRWITPELSPIRFDARFFVARMPPCQEALHDGSELTGHMWVTPGQALKGYRERRFPMVVPIIMTLEELSRFDTIDAVIESTKGKKIQGVLTRMVLKGDEAEEHTPDGRIFRHSILPHAGMS